MGIDKEQADDFEKKYSGTIFEEILRNGSEQSEVISQMKKNATNLGQSDENIPNTGYTLNIELATLSRQFKNAGISMFYKKNEDYGFVASSFVGDAIIYDLLDKYVESIKKLGEYGKTMGDVSKQRNERLLALQNVGPIRKFFSRIRAFFVPVQPVDLSLTEEEDTLDSSLQAYKDIYLEIFNYSLEGNIVQALVKKIAGTQGSMGVHRRHRYGADGVPGLLEESVIPDLKKLGLEHLIPQLQEALIEEYKKDLPDPEFYQVKDEDMHSYVPDFSQKPTKKRKVPEDLQHAQKVRKGDIISDGLGLESFAAVDSSVSATQRKTAIEAMRGGLSGERPNDAEKPNEKDGEII